MVVLDLPTTEFTVLQHPNILGQCLDMSNMSVLYATPVFVFWLNFTQGTKDKRQEPCLWVSHRDSTPQLQATQSFPAVRWQEAQARLGIQQTILHPAWQHCADFHGADCNLNAQTRIYMSKMSLLDRRHHGMYHWLKKFLQMVKRTAAMLRWTCCCWHRLPLSTCYSQRCLSPACMHSLAVYLRPASTTTATRTWDTYCWASQGEALFLLKYTFSHPLNIWRHSLSFAWQDYFCIACPI